MYHNTEQKKPILIPVIYNNKKYPDGIMAKIQEIPARFDSKVPMPSFFYMDYSLHTEYSHSPTKFSNPACNGLSALKITDRRGVPKLWYNLNWVREFVKYIFRFVGDKRPPKIIEIHPPFDDYCRGLSQFIDLYEEFEEDILVKFPNAEILIENRYGSQYREGKFLISTINDLLGLVKLIESRNLKLRLAVDIPQLFAASGLTAGTFSKTRISELFNSLKAVREYISNVHLWAKYRNEDNKMVVHRGRLDKYLGDLKSHFLNELYDLLSDGRPRYFLPEINASSAELHLMVRDLIIRGFHFV